MCAPQWLRYLLGVGIPHISCLSPAGYSTVLQDSVSKDPVPLELHLALTWLELKRYPLSLTTSELV